MITLINKVCPGDCGCVRNGAGVIEVAPFGRGGLYAEGTGLLSDQVVYIMFRVGFDYMNE